MKKTVVFDLDGTLAHTAPTLASAMNIFLRNEGREEIAPALMETFLGNGVRVLLTKVYTHLGLPREKADIDRAVEKFFVSYESTYLDAALYDGIYGCVKMLCDRGVSVCVLSNKPHRFVPPLVEKLLPGLPVAFSFGQTDKPRKPDPTVLLELIRDTGSDPDNCIFVGDSEVDVNTARNAGVKCCAVSWGYREKDLLVSMDPEFIADTAEQLCEILENFISE